mmetsp:Transcript_40425/g.75699  ORF Transcript_40425/g.75699 Transcript_40425/m.75699 type:complete len:163 (+) Transcript_40425:112-600(+)
MAEYWKHPHRSKTLLLLTLSLLSSATAVINGRQPQDHDSMSGTTSLSKSQVAAEAEKTASAAVQGRIDKHTQKITWHADSAESHSELTRKNMQKFDVKKTAEEYQKLAASAGSSAPAPAPGLSLTESSQSSSVTFLGKTAASGASIMRATRRLVNFFIHLFS